MRAPTECAVQSADGTRIAYWRSGSGDPLVLVHGTSADHGRWARVVPALKAAFTVYAVDRRGRDASGDQEVYAIEREFEDIAAVLDDIGGPITLVGHSYGAICALEASLLSGSVARLILYEPPIPVGIEIYAPGTLEQLAEMLAEDDREGILMTFMTEIVRMPRAQAEQFRSLSGWDARVALAHTVVRETQADERYRFDAARWRRFTVPTLLLHGGDSPPFLVTATEIVSAALPHSTLHVLPGQQHVAMETAPELFVEAILRFCNRRAERGRPAV
ncbi:MAG TPA: alpha/beta hydrolase [Solirubrobacteraceae bacterium]|nr:alpha/beta hydrolase [Solirubrobacteraceae bacterium]